MDIREVIGAPPPPVSDPSLYLYPLDIVTSHWFLSLFVCLDTVTYNIMYMMPWGVKCLPQVSLFSSSAIGYPGSAGSSSLTNQRCKPYNEDAGREERVFDPTTDHALALHAVRRRVCSYAEHGYFHNSVQK